jgi:hypothetical protein
MAISVPAANARRRAKAKAHGRTTAHWQRVREEVIARDGGRCRMCGLPGRSVHLDPARGGDHRNATAADCVTLCAHHHGVVDAPRATRNRPAPGGWGAREPGEGPTRPARVFFPPPKPKKAGGGSMVARGYGPRHFALRRRWERLVRRGGVLCARCRRPIPADATRERCPGILAAGRVCGKLGCGWHLGHHDTDRSRYTGPEHACCNAGAPRRAGGMIATVVRSSERW